MDGGRGVGVSEDTIHNISFQFKKQTEMYYNSIFYVNSEYILLL